MSRANRGVLIACAIAATGCGGAGASRAGPITAPAETVTAAPPPAASSPADVSAQVRTVRGGCSTEATKQQLEVVDFVTFNPLDESNWDSTIRVRRKGRLVRIGCRYDLKAAMAHIYEPSTADGGSPWGPGGPPKASTSVPAQGPAADGRSEAGAAPPRSNPRAEPTRTEPPRTEAPKAKPASPPVPGSKLNLNAIADTAARSAVARTRDACLAEATRRKIAFDDFDEFHRIEGTRWEASLLSSKGKGSWRKCQVDVATGKATIK